MFYCAPALLTSPVEGFSCVLSNMLADGALSNGGRTVKQESGVCNNLRATRTRLGRSQQELATAAGVTRQTVGGIEAGLFSPSALVALRLAKALGCRLEELFWLEED